MTMATVRPVSSMLQMILALSLWRCALSRLLRRRHAGQAHHPQQSIATAMQVHVTTCGCECSGLEASSRHCVTTRMASKLIRVMPAPQSCSHIRRALSTVRNRWLQQLHLSSGIPRQVNRGTLRLLRHHFLFGGLESEPIVFPILCWHAM